MRILPSMEKVREIAATGNYKVLPVSCEILSDICTPIEAMKILKNVSSHCYLLESVGENEKWGRYTFLGFDPKLEITCIDGQMKAGDIQLQTDNPSEFLRQILAEYQSPRFDYLPSFTGGPGRLFLLRLSGLQRALCQNRGTGYGSVQGCRPDAV